MGLEASAMLSHADALWRSEGLEDTEKRLDRSRRGGSPFFPWKPTELVLKVFLGSPFFPPMETELVLKVFLLVSGRS